MDWAELYCLRAAKVLPSSKQVSGLRGNIDMARELLTRSAIRDDLLARAEEATR